MKLSSPLVRSVLCYLSLDRLGKLLPYFLREHNRNKNFTALGGSGKVSVKMMISGQVGPTDIEYF
jgi:hypothetical protein